MKKLLFTLALALTCSTSFAKSVEDIMNEFNNKPDVVFVDMPKSMMESQFKLNGDEKIKDIIEKTESVKVLVLQECSEEVNADFDKAVSQLDTNEYEPIVNVNQTENNVKVMSKTNGDLITEFLVMVNQPNNNIMVQIKGSFTQEDLATITNMINK